MSIYPVTMTTLTSSHVKDENSIFTSCSEDIIPILETGEILVFRQHLYNINIISILVGKTYTLFEAFKLELHSIC